MDEITACLNCSQRLFALVIGCSGLDTDSCVGCFGAIPQKDEFFGVLSKLVASY